MVHDVPEERPDSKVKSRNGKINAHIVHRSQLGIAMTPAAAVSAKGPTESLAMTASVWFVTIIVPVIVTVRTATSQRRDPS